MSIARCIIFANFAAIVAIYGSMFLAIEPSWKIYTAWVLIWAVVLIACLIVPPVESSNVSR